MESKRRLESDLAVSEVHLEVTSNNSVVSPSNVLTYLHPFGLGDFNRAHNVDNDAVLLLLDIEEDVVVGVVAREAKLNDIEISVSLEVKIL